MQRLPVPRPHGHDLTFRDLSRLARRLSVTGIEGDEAAYIQVNSLAAALYRVTPTQYAHVVGTFPLLPGSLRDRLLDDYVRVGASTKA